MSRTSQSDPILLRPYGDNDGKDEYTQLIVIGEGALGSEFDIPGNYTLQAKYIYKEESIVSSKKIVCFYQFYFFSFYLNEKVAVLLRTLKTKLKVICYFEFYNRPSKLLCFFLYVLYRR